MTALAYGNAVTPGLSGYATQADVTSTLSNGLFSMAWGIGATIVSSKLAARKGGGLWKARERLPLDEPEPQLDAIEACGVLHPASFGDCYHQLAPELPRIPHTINGLFSWWPGGPWEEARKVGKHFGKFYRYDLCSAYRWAATLGLPDPATYCVRHDVDPLDHEGLWCVYIEDDVSGLPPLLQTNGPVVMSTEEIRAYGVRVRLIRGVTWTRTFPANYVENTLQRLPCAKEAGRAYWGRWIARDKLKCYTPSKSWELPNRSAHFVWGWLIVGRVRLRVWESAAQAVHVYVDEVLVPHELPTGETLGAWRLKEQYSRGVEVVRTGWYGAPGMAPAMQTGVGRASFTHTQ